MPVHITSGKDFLKFKNGVLSNRRKKSKPGDSIRNSLAAHGRYDNFLLISRAGGLQEQL